jgi:hypothetical protein
MIASLDDFCLVDCPDSLVIGEGFSQSTAGLQGPQLADRWAFVALLLA